VHDVARGLTWSWADNRVDPWVWLHLGC